MGKRSDLWLAAKGTAVGCVLDCVGEALDAEDVAAGGEARLEGQLEAYAALVLLLERRKAAGRLRSSAMPSSLADIIPTITEIPE